MVIMKGGQVFCLLYVKGDITYLIQFLVGCLIENFTSCISLLDRTTEMRGGQERARGEARSTTGQRLTGWVLMYFIKQNSASVTMKPF